MKETAVIREKCIYRVKMCPTRANKTAITGSFIINRKTIVQVCTYIHKNTYNHIQYTHI